MLRINAGTTRKYCDGLSRRNFVQIGVAGMASVEVKQAVKRGYGVRRIGEVMPEGAVLAKAGGAEQMAHFEYVVDGGDAPAGHNISFVDVTPQVDGGNYVGFALDTIQVHDWLI